MLRTIWAGALLLALAGSAVAEDWTGKYVIFKNDDAFPIASKPGDPFASLQRDYESSFFLKVRKDHGTDLELEGIDGKIKKADVVRESEAIDFWTKIIEKNAANPKYYIRRAACYERLGDEAREQKNTAVMKKHYDSAVDNYTKAIAIDGDNAVWRLKRTYIYFLRYEPALANKDIAEAIRLQPKWHQPYLTLGGILNTTGQYDDAIRFTTQAIELNPKIISSFHNRYAAWMAKHDFDKAIADMDKAIEIDPKSAASFELRSLAWAAKQEFDNALKDLNAAIAINSERASAWQCRGGVWYCKKEYDKAIEDSCKAIELDPKSTRAFNVRAAAWNAKRNYEKALQDITIAIELNPEDSRMYSSRASTFYYINEFDKSMSDINEAIRIDPKESIYYSSRARIWLEKKEYYTANNDLYKATELNSNNEDAYRIRGTVWCRMNKWDFARIDYRKALELKPKDVRALSSLAFFYSTCPLEEYRDGAKALELAKAALAEEDCWQYREVLAAAYAETGDFDNAVKEETKAIEMQKKEKYVKPSEIADSQKYLGLFKAKKPYRQE